MRLTIHRFDLPLRHVFTISRGSTAVSRTVIVELEHAGRRGYGEAGESDYYGATAERIAAAIEAARPVVESWDAVDVSDFHRRLLAAVPHSFARCALDIAAWDLWGKLADKPLWQCWGLAIDRLPPTDYTIGIDGIEAMIAKLKEFDGWPVYKIKLGTPHDVEIVRRLRHETDAVFRVDANAAWTARQTLKNAAMLAELGVEFIEQPLPPDDWRGMEKVYGQSALPIVADESCLAEADVERCAACFHGVNVKLVKCGGLTPARRMLARARQLGLKTMVGCMTESTVGISAIGQLLPLLDYADMDGALLLATDVARGVRIERGKVRLPTLAGTGVELLGWRPGRCRP